MKEKWYEILKWIVVIVIPAVVALYTSLGQIWNLPMTDQIVQTISVVGVFLGAVFMFSNKSYAGDGSISIGDTDPDTEEAEVEMNFNADVEELKNKKTIVLKVEN